jgi:MFS family permease
VTAAPGVLAAFREPRYRLLWLAGLCVNAARWMDLVVLGWLTLALTDSPFMVGVAAFCRTAPMMVLGLVAGVVADRFHRGRVLFGVQVVNLLAAAGLGLTWAVDAGSFRVLIALEIVFGIAWAVDFPVRRAVLSTLVGPRGLTNAVSLEAVSTQGSKMLGPLLGGLLLARVGPTAAYFVLALVYLTALLLVVRLGRGLALPGAPGLESVLASLATGLREVRAQPVILGVLAITVLMNTLVFPYQQMLPVFARDVLAVGPLWLGLLIAVEGLGSLAGALAVAARHDLRRHWHLFASASLAAAVLLLAFAASAWYPVSLLIQFAFGVAEAGFGTMQSAIVLLSAPAAARGRAMGVLSACIGTQPLGMLWIGFLTSRVGAPLATAIGAALALALMLPVARRLRAPGPLGSAA